MQRITNHYTLFYLGLDMERHTQHTTSVTTQLNICRHIVMRGARLLCSCLMGASKRRTPVTM